MSELGFTPFLRRAIFASCFTLARGALKEREISLYQERCHWLCAGWQNEPMPATGWLKAGRCPLGYQAGPSQS